MGTHSGTSARSPTTGPGRHYVLERENRLGQAKDDEVKGIVCVHESLCAEGDIGGMIWNDAGTHAKADGSVWEIKPKSENGIHAHTFFCQDNHSRPNEKVYVIAKGPKVKLKDIS
jgi:hypothetical protein